MTDKNRTRAARTATALATLLGAGALLFQAGAASAADLPSRDAAPAPAPITEAPPVFTWTGFYIGANAGWGGRTRNVGFGVTPGANNPNIASLNPSGGILGLQAGYNWQIGAVVLGMETDIQATRMRDRFGPVGLAGGGFASGSSRTSWYGTVRARAGYAFGNTMLFATGGLAYGNTDNRLTAIDGAGNTFTMPKGKTRVGWTLGGGIEHAFTQNWSAKLEYGYVDLRNGRDRAAVFNAGLPTGAIARSRNDAGFHTIRAGINYRF